MYAKAQSIIMQVALQTGVPMDLITKKGRMKNVQIAKTIVRWRMREETDLSLREIDMAVGGNGSNHRIIKPEHTS